MDFSTYLIVLILVGFIGRSESRNLVRDNQREQESF